MGWEIGFDERWNRDIGYGVLAWCDHPDCQVEIDRGLGFVCGGEPYGGHRGCGLYFCYKHRSYRSLCARCMRTQDPFEPKPEHPVWICHRLTDPSWAEWRKDQGLPQP